METRVLWEMLHHVLWCRRPHADVVAGVVLCTQRMVLGAIHVNPSPGLGGLRIFLTIAVLVFYQVLAHQNHPKVGAWCKETVTAPVCVRACLNNSVYLKLEGDGLRRVPIYTAVLRWGYTKVIILRDDSALHVKPEEEPEPGNLV